MKGPNHGNIVEGGGEVSTLQTCQQQESWTRSSASPFFIAHNNSAAVWKKGGGRHSTELC